MTDPQAWAALTRACFDEVVAAAKASSALDRAKVDRLVLRSNHEWPATCMNGELGLGIDLDVALEVAAERQVPDATARPEWVRLALVTVIASLVADHTAIGRSDADYAVRGQLKADLVAATPTGATLPTDAPHLQALRDKAVWLNLHDKSLRPPDRITRCLECRTQPPAPGGDGRCEGCATPVPCTQCGTPSAPHLLNAGVCESCNWDRGFSSHSERADRELERDADAG